jgi:hypothetical protein
LINGQGGAAPLAGAVLEAGSDYTSMMAVTFPAAFGGGTFNFNPFTSDRLLGVSHWFRFAVQWLVLVTLGAALWKDMGEWVRGLSTMRQAQGNTIAAGTGAQATALVAAGLITAAVVVCTAGLMAWSFGDVSFAAIRSMAVSSPLLGMPAAALGMLSEILPVATIVSCAIARYSFRFFGASLFATCSAIVRFIVP